MSGCTTTTVGLSTSQRRAYDAFFQKNIVIEADIVDRLAKTARDREFFRLKLGILAFGETGALPLQVTEWNLNETRDMRQDERIWCSAIRKRCTWNDLAEFICSRARFLRRIAGQSLVVNMEGSPAFVLLTFQVPRSLNLQLGRCKVMLSEKAQQHLYLHSTSEYPCDRRVLIVEEPHSGVSQQWQLLQGIQVLLSENPHLQDPHSTIFLSEGYPSEQRIPIRKMIEVEPQPGNQLIRETIATFFITGYMAHEWKYQNGIHTVGTEDPQLWKICARMRARIGIKFQGTDVIFWNLMCASRNQKIASSLLDQLDEYASPVLFVGSGHLDTLSHVELTHDRLWEKARHLVSPSDAALVRAQDKRGIAEILEEKGVGYFYFQAVIPLFVDRLSTETYRRRYTELFRAQIKDDTNTYIESLLHHSRLTTVRPSPADAAKFVRARKRAGKRTQARAGDLIVRHGRGILGPPLTVGLLDDIPHIGILGRSGAAYDLRKEKVNGTQCGVIYSVPWDDETRFKNPGFFSVLAASEIPVRWGGKVMPMHSLPPSLKEAIRDSVCDLASHDLNKNVGEYSLISHCGDWSIGIYDQALSRNKVTVLRYKGLSAFSDIFQGSLDDAGLVDSSLRDWLVNDWLALGAIMDPSEVNDRLPRVAPPRDDSPTSTAEAKENYNSRARALAILLDQVLKHFSGTLE